MIVTYLCSPNALNHFCGWSEKKRLIKKCFDGYFIIFFHESVCIDYRVTTEAFHLEKFLFGNPLFNNDKPVAGYEQYPLLKNIVDKKYQPIIDLLLFMVMFNRPFAGPPGIAADRLEVLRQAFYKSWHDPEMLKKAELMKRPVNYTGYAEGEKLIENALNQPPDVVKLIKEAYGN